MLTLGQQSRFSGDVTTLNWIGPRPAAEVERNLGYAPGRLAMGYWIILLKEPLKPDHFEFGGTTLRSGGRAGLPARTKAADEARIRVHKDVLDSHGLRGYRDMQERALRSVPMIGERRIAKVLPVTRHDDNMAPADQYPMGGGGLQWTIKKSHPRLFLVALEVDRDGVARAPTFSVSLRIGAPYENRVKVKQYLETA